ncbi:hypothetical protein [Nesterenkonia pannonica]|uniref:hypothetical protein n=1 Tax=Nesterenkonia pannonica TaxID=1548602 RepID=UPI002164C7B0|nr:hypothetical protein [Nesterenkonia pannonica]
MSELRLGIEAVSSSAVLDEDGPQLESSLENVQVELKSPLLSSVMMASLQVAEANVEPRMSLRSSNGLLGEPTGST